MRIFLPPASPALLAHRLLIGWRWIGHCGHAGGHWWDIECIVGVAGRCLGIGGEAGGIRGDLFKNALPTSCG